MAFGKTGRECRLNRSEIASSHGQADIHPIGMQGFEPAQVAPGCEDRCVFQEGHQKVLVIACQGNDGSWPFATCKSFDHALGAKTAVDIVAEENRHGMVERGSFHIGTDALGHFPEQVVTTMDIAHAVYPGPIRDTTRDRNRGRRFPKRLQEWIQPTAWIW